MITASLYPQYFAPLLSPVPVILRGWRTAARQSLAPQPE
jgi:hypothetical protein